MNASHEMLPCNRKVIRRLDMLFMRTRLRAANSNDLLTRSTRKQC